MPQYFSPGVYVEEVDAGPRPIEGVSTSVTGMVGVTRRGPIGRPILVTSFKEFVDKFGKHWPAAEQATFAKSPFETGEKGRVALLPNAVEGFFANGGQQLYVVRISAIKDGEGIAKGTFSSVGGTKYADIEALEPGSWGNSVKISVSQPEAGSTRLVAAAATGVADVEVADASRIDVNTWVTLTASDEDSPKKHTARVTAVVAPKVTLAPPLSKAFPKGADVSILRDEMTWSIEDSASDRIETFTGLKRNDAAFNTKALAASKIVKVSNFQDIPLNEPFPEKAELTSGDDKAADLDPTHFKGEDLAGGRTGIKALEDVDDISIVAAPGIWDTEISQALYEHCERMQYRFAILDADPDDDIEAVRKRRKRLSSKYAGLYYPWVNVRQPEIADPIQAPPSGHLAGIYADVDRRRGVHKAPANEIVKNIVGVSRVVNRREQDLLNPEGINALRFFPGRGNLVWGARTISSDSNFKYVNVRRIFNFIERSIDAGTQFVVFEPNDEMLWSRVRQTVSNFLHTQWRAGMLEGATPAEAFFVACNRGTTMTQAQIENGELIAEIGIAPVFPAEFVIFRIQKFTADSKLS